MARRARSTLAAHAAGNERDRASWGWALVGALLGLGIALLLFAPARWLADAALRLSNGHVRLEAARGTVWDGSAQLVLSGGQDSRDATALPGRLEWTLRPRWNGASAALLNRCCMGTPINARASVSFGGAQLQLADGVSHWPAALLSGLGAPFNTLQPEGQLDLATHGFNAVYASGRWQFAGSVTLDAVDMSSRLSTLRPMGSYRVTVVGGAAPSLRLETLSGALQLDGAGQFVGGRLRFEGTASAAPDRIDALANLLNIIGRRDGARSLIRL
ncbi:MAG: type II secretion system protein N [Burkholderiaceae bacterium]